MRLWTALLLCLRRRCVCVCQSFAAPTPWALLSAAFLHFPTAVCEYMWISDSRTLELVCLLGEGAQCGWEVRIQQGGRRRLEVSHGAEQKGEWETGEVKRSWTDNMLSSHSLMRQGVRRKHKTGPCHCCCGGVGKVCRGKLSRKSCCWRKCKVFNPLAC